MVYRRPDGTAHGFRWTEEEKVLLRRLSPEATVAHATAALHLSLPPSLDAGRLFTTAMRRAFSAAVEAGTLPPPHPDRGPDDSRMVRPDGPDPVEVQS